MHVFTPLTEYPPDGTIALVKVIIPRKHKETVYDNQTEYIPCLIHRCGENFDNEKQCNITILGAPLTCLHWVRLDQVSLLTIVPGGIF